jgi:hypothetical protein
MIDRQRLETARGRLAGLRAAQERGEVDLGLCAAIAADLEWLIDRADALAGDNQRLARLVAEDARCGEGIRDYVPAVAFARSEAELRDQSLSWQRSDEAFFAAGACHILAFRFLFRHPGEGFRLVYLRPERNGIGHHVYATDGTWAFDFNGWTREETLLVESTRACRRKDPSWSCRRHVIAQTLEEFCRDFGFRRPDQYVLDPTARADAYLDRLVSGPRARARIPRSRRA